MRNVVEIADPIRIQIKDTFVDKNLLIHNTIW
jgi:hypothetical protein